MTEENQLIKICLFYQMFMERAYGSYALQKPALQAPGMRNLIIAEKSVVLDAESAVHFEEQLQEIKKMMEAAFDSYLALPNAPGNIMMELMWYKHQVAVASNSEELMKIVMNTIDLTNPLFKTQE